MYVSSLLVGKSSVAQFSASEVFFSVVCVSELSVCVSCMRRARTPRSAAVRTTSRTTPAALRSPAPAAGEERLTTPGPRLLLRSAPRSSSYSAHTPCWSAANSTARHGTAGLPYTNLKVGMKSKMNNSYFLMEYCSVYYKEFIRALHYFF